MSARDNKYQHQDALDALRTMRALFRHGAADVAAKVCEEFFDKHNPSKNCLHCGEEIVTGSGTGRRSHSKFCSDACRVANMRKRNAENAA